MPEDKQESKNNTDWNLEELDNAVSFFGLLLEVDRRLNPEKYVEQYD